MDLTKSLQEQIEAAAKRREKDIAAVASVKAIVTAAKTPLVDPPARVRKADQSSEATEYTKIQTSHGFANIGSTKAPGQNPTLLVDEKDLPMSVVDFLVRIKVADSKRDAKRLIQQGGIHIQLPGKEWTTVLIETQVTKEMLIPRPYCTLTLNGKSTKVFLKD